jgi:hypothetical protein
MLTAYYTWDFEFSVLCPFYCIKKNRIFEIWRTSFCSWEVLGRNLHNNALRTKHFIIPGQRMRCTYFYVGLLHNYDHIFSAVGNKKTRNVCLTQQWGALVQPMLQWKSNTYYIFWVCVSLTSSIQNSMRMCHIVICELSGSYILLHIISKKIFFLKKELYWI